MHGRKQERRPRGECDREERRGRVLQQESLVIQRQQGDDARGGPVASTDSLDRGGGGRLGVGCGREAVAGAIDEDCQRLAGKLEHDDVREGVAVRVAVDVETVGKSFDPCVQLKPACQSGWILFERGEGLTLSRRRALLSGLDQ